jgi:hypothetical protein
MLLGRKGGGDREVQLRRRSLVEQTTDYRRWTDARNYNPEWSPRSALAIELLDHARWVCDLGCGAQALRKQLPADSIYLPMDLKQWTDDTIVCDINRRSLPTDYLELCDFCFVMGVLEYIYDTSWFLDALARSAEGIIISYNVAELSLDRREDNGWVNSLTSQQFKTLIESAGFKILDTRLYINERLPKNGQLIVKAINPAFDSVARVRRQESRARFLKRDAVAAVAE